MLDIFKPALSNSLQVLETGDTDLALSHLPRVIRIAVKNSDICVVGKLIEKPLNGFLFLKDSGIKTMYDLNGRVVGYCSARFNLPVFELLLSEKDIHLGSKINVGEDLVSNLITKQIEVAYGAMKNVQPYQLEALGYAARFFSVTEFGLPEYEGLVVAGNSRRSQEVAPAFQKALQRSIDFCRENPDVAFEMYANIQQDISSKTLAWHEKSWQHTVTLLAHSQQFSREKVKNLVSWLEEKGIIAKRVPADSIFCPQILSE